MFEARAEGAEGFSRRVAIKRLLAEHAAEPAVVRMFLDEARIASHLHHANIVSVLDYGVLDGLPFQVLQFVDGLDAVQLYERAKHRGRELPVELVLYLCAEIAHALHYAHRASDSEGVPLGIVHRDVSPANMLVSWSGEVHLADFGIAFAKDRSERTAAGMTKGTPSYIAPEQAIGGAVDPRADVFALAATCHRLLSGHSPLAGDHAMVDLLAGRELTLDPAIPDDVAAVLRRALRRDRAARQPDAAAFAQELGTTLARRIDRDPRTVLHKYLEQLRDAGPARARGRFDDLVGIGLDLVAVGEHDGVRSFESRTTRAPLPVLGGARRGRGLGLAIAAAIVLGVVAFAWSTRTADTAPVVASREPPVDPAPTDSPLPATPLPVPSAAVEPAVPTVEAPVTTTERERAATVRGPRDKRPTPTRGDDPPVATGTGILHIGGAKAVRAEIRVDGKPMGYAPKRLELRLGPHELVLVDGTGKSVATRHIEMTARHTASSPLRWIVDS